MNIELKLPQHLKLTRPNIIPVLQLLPVSVFTAASQTEIASLLYGDVASNYDFPPVTQQLEEAASEDSVPNTQTSTSRFHQIYSTVGSTLNSSLETADASLTRALEPAFAAFSSPFDTKGDEPTSPQSDFVTQ